MNTINETRKKVLFVWVPSHCGIAGNELADQEAAATVINSVPIEDFLRKQSDGDRVKQN